MGPSIRRLIRSIQHVTYVERGPTRLSQPPGRRASHQPPGPLPRGAFYTLRRLLQRRLLLLALLALELLGVQNQHVLFGRALNQ